MRRLSISKTNRHPEPPKIFEPRQPTAMATSEHVHLYEMDEGTFIDMTDMRNYATFISYVEERKILPINSAVSFTFSDGRDEYISKCTIGHLYLGSPPDTLEGRHIIVIMDQGNGRYLFGMRELINFRREMSINCNENNGIALEYHHYDIRFGTHGWYMMT